MEIQKFKKVMRLVYDKYEAKQGKEAKYEGVSFVIGMKSGIEKMLLMNPDFDMETTNDGLVVVKDCARMEYFEVADVESITVYDK